MKIGVYPGSFDPFTVGHLDVLTSACRLFDEVYVAVLKHPSKHAVFTDSERQEMIRRVVDTEGLANAKVACFDGLLVDYAKQVGASHIIRGLRAITDFEYEFQIDAVNRHLAPDLHTVYFMASPKHSFLSSSNVREIGTYCGNIVGLVPQCNIEIIGERLARQ
ncbi:MAG: pantetheine-phosphate adenylyltransferase [Clostridiales bacterium]|nr:pantetheine-phosphate adenylyltransferase [Clostridiales bacterium]